MGRLYSRRSETEHYMYPSELEVIIGYLKKQGDVKCTRKEIESAFFKYSNEHWSDWISIEPDPHFCKWLPVTNSILISFEEWLNNED